MATVLHHGIEVDVLFRLRSRQGGALRDDDEWVNGSTSAQWPTVQFFNQNEVDKTSLFVVDLTSVTLPAPYQKGVPPTTGVIRDGAVGKYRVRVQPDVSLSLVDTYRMRITADIGGAPYEEEFEITLRSAGDVEVGNEHVYATVDEVLENFELEGIVTEGQVDLALTRGELYADAQLEAIPITPVPYTTKSIRALKLAAIAYARGELRRLVTAATGPGTNVRVLVEGDTRYEFMSADSVAKAMFGEGDKWMELAIKAILGGEFSFGVADMNADTRY